MVIYKLGGINFKTWGEVNKHAQNILNKGHRTLEDKDLHFVQDLFQYHPNIENKSRNGIKTIKVGNPQFGTGNAFLIVDNTGNQQDISYKKCRPITKKDKNRAINKDKKNQINKAYREAIEKEIRNYWQSNKLKICNQCNSTKNIQVDHVKPFIELINEYETLNNVVEYPEIERINGNIHTFKFSAATEKSSLFVDNWKRYHNENATLQFLCRKCNVIKHSSGKKYRKKI